MYYSQTSTGNAKLSTGNAKISPGSEDLILLPACHSKVSTFELVVKAFKLPPPSKPKNLHVLAILILNIGNAFLSSGNTNLVLAV